MAWTLTHRFLTGAGEPARGWVFFGVVASPSVTPVGTFVSTADKVRLDRSGAFLVNDLPSDPALSLTVWPRIDKGKPWALGPVTVPMQPDGAVVDLHELITDWGGTVPPGGVVPLDAPLPYVLA